MRQELDKVSGALQQAEFDNETLTSQLQVAKAESSGKPGASYQEEYYRLQAQMSDILEQKNSANAQLSQALHSLQQREARCQQLAMQVSQLAEDRGYLNTQLANLSKSLREKEQEWLAIRQQYATVYQAYIAGQAKTAELERRIALDSVQKELDEEETGAATEADQARAHKDVNPDQRLVELQSSYQALIENQAAVSNTLSRERNLREQLERDLEEAQEQIKILVSGGTGREVTIDLEDGDSRIPETTAMLRGCIVS